MRILPNKKLSIFREREERLRKGHAAAHTLRNAFPTATHVTVQLRFLPAAAPPHAEQSFVLYPGARAFFAYPCPYGDCNGIYDLRAEAVRALGGEKSRVAGTLECGGVRCKDGLLRQPCGLRVSYTISARHSSEGALAHG
jgi:hypothetical protein